MTEQLAMEGARRRRIRRRLRRQPGLTIGGDDGTRSARSTRQRGFLASLDKPMLAIVILLLLIGSMMVYSATFDWSNETYGTATGFFVQEHLRNVAIASLGMLFMAAVDYRFWKRFSIWLLLLTIGALIAVLAFGDVVFGARRSLMAGRFQPGELAEFAIVVYLAAWFGSRNTRVGSFLFGFVPFALVVGIITFLITQQPDLSSAAIVALTAGMMYYVAGANLLHLVGIGSLVGAVGFLLIQGRPYAQLRIADFLAGLGDLTLTNYHTQQAIAAFMKGGWTGVGLGQSAQKFGALPAPHTDSIFAVIGEEFGVIGAAVVVALYVALAIRGFRMARGARDAFGSLLCVGFTSWVIMQALLNIAVMTNTIPSTGVPLPFISFGGSSLLVVMVGVGLMLSVQRVATRRDKGGERRSEFANHDWGWRHRRSYLSRAGGRSGAAGR